LLLACGGKTYARLRLNTGPGGELRLPVEIDFQEPFPAADQSAWDDVGLSKVEATARALRQIDSAITLTLVEDRFRPQLSVGDVVFCCVDSICR
jgi:hypothetical protein